jgi:hypothetical protein
LGSDNDNVEYITVENCLLWGDRARIFLLGHESRAPYMRHMVQGCKVSSKIQPAYFTIFLKADPKIK